MGEVGILREDDRVELVLGEIVQMAPIGQPHALCVATLVQLFARRLGDRAVVWPQNPIAIVPDSEPQPDVALLAPPGTRYRLTRPRPDDVLLLVEVADASIDYDRRVKGPLYASAGIREYWIVDLEGGAIEVHREPRSGGYARVSRVERGAALAPEAFPGVRLTAAEILG